MSGLRGGRGSEGPQMGLTAESTKITNIGRVELGVS